jgi:hypothetical protein
VPPIGQKPNGASYVRPNNSLLVERCDTSTSVFGTKARSSKAERLPRSAAFVSAPPET